jgi:hypothetical protein
VTATKQDLINCKSEVDERMDTFNERLAPIEADIKRIREIVEAWDSAKGFINVVRAISAVFKMLAVPVAALAALWYLITTGHLPPK